VTQYDEFIACLTVGIPLLANHRDGPCGVAIDLMGEALRTRKNEFLENAEIARKKYVAREIENKVVWLVRDFLKWHGYFTADPELEWSSDGPKDVVPHLRRGLRPGRGKGDESGT
jgi:hypothetical protein